MNEIIAPVPSKNPFSLTRSSFGTFPAQYLVPLHHPVATLPGDQFECVPHMGVQMFPFNDIFFGNIKVNVDSFFVSLRSLYGDLWYKYFLLNKIACPTVSARDCFAPFAGTVITIDLDNQYWKLLDMLGYPTELVNNAVSDTVPVNPSKFLMYWRIVLDYYVDPQLDSDIHNLIENALETLRVSVESSMVDYANGDMTQAQAQSYINAAAKTAVQALFTQATQDDESAPVNLFQRRIHRDYFTTILPNLQFGDPMRVPVSGPFVDTDQGSRSNIHTSNSAGSTSTMYASGVAGETFSRSVAYVVGGTIEELHRMEDVQNFLKRLNFAGGEGANLKELSEAIYGDKPDNVSLHTAMWLSSFDRDLVLSEVVQTSNGSADSDPLGTKVVNGTISTTGPQFSFFTKEFGYFFDLGSIMPRVAWAAIPRDTYQETLEDWYIPDLQMIGEQEVLVREVSSWREGSTANVHNDDEMTALFGYQPRYQQYREAPDEIHSGFRTSIAQQMVHGREYPGVVNLNSDFIQYDNSLFNRIFSYVNPNADIAFVKFTPGLGALRPLVDNPNKF